MASVWPILLLAIAGLLTGGALSLHRQGAGTVPTAVVAVLAALAAVGGVFWLVG